MNQIPKYIVVTNRVNDRDFFSIECEESIVVPWMSDFEAARCVAILCNLGHVKFDDKDELVITVEPEGDPITFTPDEDYDEEDEDVADSLSTDDGPTTSTSSDDDAEFAEDDGYGYSAYPEPLSADED